MRRKMKRNALNRGTAVHLGGSKVRLVWPCGCTRIETMKSPAGPLGAFGTARFVSSWRANGVVLAQCKKHPDWHSKLNQVPRLNVEHPVIELKPQKEQIK